MSDRFFTYVGAMLMAIVGVATAIIGVRIVATTPFETVTVGVAITILSAMLLGSSIALLCGSVLLLLEQKDTERQRQQQQANLERILEVNECAECQTTDWGYCPVHEPI